MPPWMSGSEEPMLAVALTVLLFSSLKLTAFVPSASLSQRKQVALVGKMKASCLCYHIIPHSHSD